MDGAQATGVEPSRDKARIYAPALASPPHTCTSMRRVHRATAMIYPKSYLHVKARRAPFSQSRFKIFSTPSAYIYLGTAMQEVTSAKTEGRNGRSTHGSECGVLAAFATNVGRLTMRP